MSIEEAESQEVLSDEATDELVEQIESSRSSHDIPMETQAPTVKEYELEVNGRKIKATEDKILKWAQMGYDAPNKIGELNGKLTEWEQKAKDAQELKEKYGQVDEYIQQNPEWWEHVQNQYQQQIQSAQQQAQQAEANDPVLAEVNALKQELNELRDFKLQLETEKAHQERAKEDEALSGEIQGVKQAWRDLPWDEPDEQGKTLEVKVLEHAHLNGIPNFKTAFKDFYFDNLLKMAENRAKTSVSKQIQTNSKLGLLGKSATPVKEVRPAVNTKSKSYSELAREAIDELYG